MRKGLLALAIFIGYSAVTGAQTQSYSFGFLELPRSAHEAALGGHVVSLREPDPTLAYSNPAVLTGTSSPALGLNVMTWLAGTTVAGAQYCNPIAKRSAFAVSARYVNYGITDQTDNSGNLLGTYSSRDISLAGSYSYRLGDRWSGGVTMRFIYSKYSSYSSFAIASDLGIIYSSASGRFNAGLTFSNMGGQIKPFQDTREELPFDISAGMTWRLAHAPLRITATLDRLDKWDSKDFYCPEGSLDFRQILARHINLGADILITDNIYVAIGYNLRNGAELSTNSKKGLTGFTIGAGMHIKKVQFSLAFGKFQVSTSSLLFNFAINI